ncbi:MAG: type III pantothenate kinase [Cyclobacteriaceae bacterium]|nr:type III pantothenate kinase [Cyclobacteriaceae bacterium]
MNLVVDAGNTRFKVGAFDHTQLIRKEFFTHEMDLKKFIEENSYDHILVSSVKFDPAEILSWSSSIGKKIVLTSSLQLPIKLAYATPYTLGVDRIAAACGAMLLFPNRDCLVIDAGTCINYEFVDCHKIYHGGAISPGISMRFEAMHAFTSKLPLVTSVSESNLIGDSTESCMQSGVMNGVLAEVTEIIQRYKDLYPEIHVILSGGDHSFFEKNLKHPIFVAPDLVFNGLNGILLYHVEL